MSGKGSRPRPMCVDKTLFDENWDAIFGEKEGKPSTDASEKENKEQEQREKEKS